MKVVDSSVVVDHLRDYMPATRVLLELAATDEVAASELVRFEVLAGAHSRDLDRVESFCATIGWIPVTEPIARVAAELAQRYRASHGGIDDVDYVIAATTMVARGELLTTNVRHFPMFAGLRPPYR